jgi:site-specific DNA-methyltransferase (adenine-specific)
VSYTGKTSDALTIQNDSMTDEKFGEFLVKAFKSADEVMKDGAAFYIWHADSEGFNFRKACRDAGWQLRETLVWNKNSLVLGRQDYQWKHEPCLYGWKKGTHHWYGDRKQTTVIDMDRPTASRLHPTMKPIGLFAYLLTNSTQNGDVVFDSFGGSGTSIMACEQLGRKCYTMELDPRYVDVIIKRWEEYTGKKAVKIA